MNRYVFFLLPGLPVHEHGYLIDRKSNHQNIDLLSKSMYSIANSNAFKLAATVFVVLESAWLVGQRCCSDQMFTIKQVWKES